MSRDGFAKVFDFEGAFESRGEEATERCDERGKRCVDEDVELYWRDVDRGRNRKKARKREVVEHRGNIVSLRDEDRVWCAGKTGDDVCAKILYSNSAKTSWVMLKASAISIYRKKALTFTGQMKYLYRISTLVMPKPKMIVQIHAPTKPSTVFLGDSLIS